ncbi:MULTISPECIES: hypothetical protein [Pseudomonas]|jgi:hypothetical protein|uniref:Uncharacterized protein n=1 Tax=Pseudomonas grimontii TaxID=129847 RepID=A0A1H1HPI8_9PSED|nr:hypothetical protein [Pseudomonas grimontii]MCS3513741.1 hypothetical protein [Pseudomonas grimontii]TWR66231.1 hypothetical protein FIV39_13600 [Pseudomonas grimontii]SDR27445.1 hypothetical protein SAMN04490186_4624 [Pseudomonas grimontii]
MPIPSIFFGITAKQLAILVIVGGAAAYLFSNHDDNTPENLELEAFILSQEQVVEHVGTVLGMTLVKQMVAYPGYNAPGYKRLMYEVEGERGRLMVTLKQVDGGQGLEVTEIRNP